MFADSSLLDILGDSGSDALLTITTVAMFNNAEIRHSSSTAVTFLNAGPQDQVAAITGTLTLAGDTTNICGNKFCCLSLG